MARNHANNGHVFRAVIVRSFVSGRVRTETFGPYDTAAPAKALITRARYDATASHGSYRNPDNAFTVTARIESAVVDWKEATS
jgi:hypothetical protein